MESRTKSTGKVIGTPDTHWKGTNDSIKNV